MNRSIVSALLFSLSLHALAHDPIPSTNWPAMTMGFGVTDKAMLDKVKPGDKVQFEFMKEGNAYVLRRLETVR